MRSGVSPGQANACCRELTTGNYTLWSVATFCYLLLVSHASNLHLFEQMQQLVFSGLHSRAWCANSHRSLQLVRIYIPSVHWLDSVCPMCRYSDNATLSLTPQIWPRIKCLALDLILNFFRLPYYIMLHRLWLCWKHTDRYQYKEGSSTRIFAKWTNEIWGF